MRDARAPLRPSAGSLRPARTSTGSSRPSSRPYASDYPSGTGPRAATSRSGLRGSPCSTRQLLPSLRARWELAYGQELPERRALVSEIFSQSCSSLASASTSRWLPAFWTRQPTRSGARARDQRMRGALHSPEGRLPDPRSPRRRPDLWRRAGIADEAERLQAVRLSFRLIHLADIESVTAAV